MKKHLSTLAFLWVFTQSIFAQIDPTDSTAQVIGYWDIGDTQSYAMSLATYKVKDGDTTSSTVIRYEVDITIKDSTENSYTIEWLYKNHQIETDNEFLKDFTELANDISVLIKTDEMGIVLEVLNWEEVRDYIGEGIGPLLEQAKKIPGAEKIIQQSIAMYKTKESIEANAIKDAIQFYTFHGIMYEFDEVVEFEMEFPNNYGGSPFDVDGSLVLEEMNVEEDNIVLRMYQVVDSEQLTDVVYQHMKESGMMGDKLPSKEDLPAVTNEVWTASRIDGDTGWPIYSIETKEIKSDDVVQIEERIIEIK